MIFKLITEHSYLNTIFYNLYNSILIIYPLWINTLPTQKTGSVEMAIFSFIWFDRNLSEFANVRLKLFWYFGFQNNFVRSSFGHFNEIFLEILVTFQNDQYKSHFERTAIIW
jgi:hypothetical protein